MVFENSDFFKTYSLPKCMLEIDGKSIIQHQVDTLRSAGIEKITIIKGHCHEKLRPEGEDFTYFINSDYKNNNILESLFYGEDVINGEVVILYFDIIFNKTVVQRLIESQNEISLVVDVNWKKNYVDRYDNPMEASEFVVSEDNLRVSKIGKIFKQSKAEIAGEFIGMMKLGSQGSKTFKSFYHRSSRNIQRKTILESSAS